jgi:hypothetical protein
MGKSHFFVGAGPTVSILYNGNLVTQTINVAQDTSTAKGVKSYFKENIDNDLPIGNMTRKYRVVHFAFNAIAGIEFTRIFLQARYSADLNEFYEEEGRSYKHKTLGFAIGVFLGQRYNSKEKKVL